jgi:hypothetical protein
MTNSVEREREREREVYWRSRRRRRRKATVEDMCYEARRAEACVY